MVAQQVFDLLGPDRIDKGLVNDDLRYNPMLKNIALQFDCMIMVKIDEYFLKSVRHCLIGYIFNERNLVLGLQTKSLENS